MDKYRSLHLTISLIINRQQCYLYSTTMSKITVEQQKRMNSVLQQNCLISKPDKPNDKSQQTGRHLTVTRGHPEFCVLCGKRHSSSGPCRWNGAIHLYTQPGGSEDTETFPVQWLRGGGEQGGVCGRLQNHNEEDKALFRTSPRQCLCEPHMPSPGHTTHHPVRPWWSTSAQSWDSGRPGWEPLFLAGLHLTRTGTCISPYGLPCCYPWYLCPCSCCHHYIPSCCSCYPWYLPCSCYPCNIPCCCWHLPCCCWYLPCCCCCWHHYLPSCLASGCSRPYITSQTNKAEVYQCTERRLQSDTWGLPAGPHQLLS